MYQLLKNQSGQTRTDMVVRVSDHANIPNNPKNRDWIAYQAWLQAGNQPLPA